MDLLIVVKCVISLLIGMVIMKVIDLNKECKIVYEYKDALSKQTEFYDILVQWQKVHQEGKSIVDYFCKNNYNTVAIYGMKELGRLLLCELSETEIKVKYCIDRNVDSLNSPIIMVAPDGQLDIVDVVIITAVHAYNDIEPGLREKLGCEVLSIEDVVYGV